MRPFIDCFLNKEGGITINYVGHINPDKSVTPEMISFKAEHLGAIICELSYLFDSQELEDL